MHRSLHQAGSLCLYYSFQFIVFRGFLSAQTSGSLCLVPALGLVFVCLFCLTLIRKLCFILLILFYFITFYYCPLAAGFLMTNRKGVNSNGKCDGKNLGRIVGREIVIRIHCVRKKLCSMKKIKEWENTKFDS